MTPDKLLKMIGFGKKSSKILSYLYRHGKSKASIIAEHINLPKSTVLYLLYKLETKELVEKKKVGKAYHFWSTDPDNILRIIDQQIEKRKARRHLVLSNLSKLRRLKDLKSDDQMQIYKEEESLDELKRNIKNQYENNDIRRIYKKNNKEIYVNDDFTFLISDNIAVRVGDTAQLKSLLNLFDGIFDNEI